MKNIKLMIFFGIFFSLLVLIFPIPTFILDILLVLDIFLFVFVFLIKNKSINSIKKYTFFICQYSLCVTISTLRLLLSRASNFDSKIITPLNPLGYIGVGITIISIVFIVITLIKCKQELNSIIFENKIINKNNGLHIMLSDSDIREKIITGYKNIIDNNYLILIYLFIIIVFNLSAVGLSEFISIAIHGEVKGQYHYRLVITVLGGFIGCFIGIFSFLINKKIMAQQKNLIDKSISEIGANGI